MMIRHFLCVLVGAQISSATTIRLTCPSAHLCACTGYMVLILLHNSSSRNTMSVTPPRRPRPCLDPTKQNSRRLQSNWLCGYAALCQPCIHFGVVFVVVVDVIQRPSRHGFVQCIAQDGAPQTGQLRAHLMLPTGDEANGALIVVVIRLWILVRWFNAIPLQSLC